MKIYAKKTFSQRKEDVEHRWVLVDAKGRVLGQVATEIAQLLAGKGKPTYTTHIDGGDYVVVINASQVVVTGRKETDKIYYRHSGYPGALKSETVAEMRSRRPEMIIELAVKNMVPKNKLRQDRMDRLKVFAGEEHPYAGQIKASEAGKFAKEQRKPGQGRVESKKAEKGQNNGSKGIKNAQNLTESKQKEVITVNDDKVIQKSVAKKSDKKITKKAETK